MCGFTKSAFAVPRHRLTFLLLLSTSFLLPIPFYGHVKIDKETVLALPQPLQPPPRRSQKVQPPPRHSRQERLLCVVVVAAASLEVLDVLRAGGAGLEGGADAGPVDGGTGGGESEGQKK